MDGYIYNTQNNCVYNKHMNIWIIRIKCTCMVWYVWCGVVWCGPNCIHFIWIDNRQTKSERVWVCVWCRMCVHIYLLVTMKCSCILQSTIPLKAAAAAQVPAASREWVFHVRMMCVCVWVLGVIQRRKRVRCLDCICVW